MNAFKKTIVKNIVSGALLLVLLLGCYIAIGVYQQTQMKKANDTKWVEVDAYLVDYTEESKVVTEKNKETNNWGETYYVEESKIEYHYICQYTYEYKNKTYNVTLSEQRRPYDEQTTFSINKKDPNDFISSSIEDFKNNTSEASLKFVVIITVIVLILELVLAINCLTSARKWKDFDKFMYSIKSK